MRPSLWLLFNSDQRHSMAKTKSHVLTDRLRLSGEVIETYATEGRAVAKILLKTCSIEIPLMRQADIHLGDCVEIDVEIRVNSVVPGLPRSERNGGK